jgi:molecular chaperone GrpE
MLRMKAGLALTSASSKAGIRRIDALGEPFDPDRHEAVFEVADAERPAGTVAEVLQLGYSGGLRRRSMANPVLAATMPPRPR